MLTPYPGTLTWYEMKKANRIVSYDWEKYDQGNVVYRPAQMSGDELRLGHIDAYKTFYSPGSIARRFPWKGKRNVVEWSIYNLFMRKGSATDRKHAIAEPTDEPELAPIPPLLPVKREWRDAVLEAIGIVGGAPIRPRIAARPMREAVSPIRLPRSHGGTGPRAGAVGGCGHRRRRPCSKRWAMGPVGTSARKRLAIGTGSASRPKKRSSKIVCDGAGWRISGQLRGELRAWSAASRRGDG